MGNALMNYLNRRLEEESALTTGKAGITGPVITISREVGCNGLKLARLIADRLNKNRMMSEWKVLSKEIFYASAKELDVDPEKVRQTLKKTDRYTFDQILKAFTDKRFKSEKKIINTVREVVRTAAIDGFNIIVGRAGHIISEDIENALHIRLTAPLDYRINTIVHNNKLTKAEAIEFIDKVEKERIAFRKAVSGEDAHEELFDITINRASFSDEMVVDMIEYAVEKKGLLTNFKKKMEFY